MSKKIVFRGELNTARNMSFSYGRNMSQAISKHFLSATIVIPAQCRVSRYY
ncbi:hypothetical protein BN433_3760 [Erwinia amylovora Ea266]|nr:hypothetical protein BN433_3760 [Erwinia amylovora Ea266]